MDNIDNEGVLKLLEEMEQKDRDLLLGIFKISDIANLLSNEDQRKKFINFYKNYVNALENISDLYTGERTKSNAEKMFKEYKSLDEDSRKELSVLLYNNWEFQGYLSQILIGVIKQNMPEMITFFYVLGIDIEKYMLDTIRSGRGYKEYIVE